MQTLKFLGRGSAFNQNEGNTSAYIKDNNELLLIDCGETVFKEIQKRKLLDDVHTVNVLITHLHSDHVGSLSSLIYYCYYVKEFEVNIYYPNKDLYNLLILNGNTDEEFNFHLVEKDNFFSINKNTIVQYRLTKHIKDINCYGITLMLNSNNYDTNIYYSGDTNKVNKGILKALITGSISEFYQDTCLGDYEGNVHLSLNKLCEAVPKDFRSKVHCMHLDCEELTDKAKSEGFNVVEV
ncbi:ribonuclease Z (plasmid) [Clostridium botulinum]|uniref:MBL fold metallo-hydrolase n=1 Tax=Clostridium botulinum TaxID=1491 RepID=UPI0006A50FDD|nr:MBL fold metallo-hydrolase [Clostridium botulinum]KOC56900.1 hypothetical protein ADU89_01525 [Clostridium botulinum]KOC57375.1 hypothetical protein ADU90_06065 [Clostridium botulinum]MCD3232611.1 ribonuclease Z [Clostridium botulinum D/C]MCD3238460.1 ribonuclease Z [Clostridium botulinum D/C]MCD3266020.1 ribonuclease Z [Clostridium botulinum D/C]